MLLQMEVKDCANARPVHSENGVHYACTLSNKRQERCFAEGRYFKTSIYAMIKNKRENVHEK